MKQRQIDPLLFSDEELSAKQKEALAEALTGSPSLAQLTSAWKELQGKFEVVETVSPAPGFVSRWQRYRIRREAEMQRKQVWITLSALATGAVLGIGVLAVTLLQALSSPANFAGEILTEWVLLSQRLEFGVSLLRIFGKDLPPIIPGIGITWISSLLAWVTVAWLVSIYKYALAGVKNGVGK